MLELAKKNSAALVYLSSMEQYGVPYIPGEVMTEDKVGIIDHLNVRSCYPEGKRMCECMCAAYASEYGVDAKIVRLAQTFGAGIPLTVLLVVSPVQVHATRLPVRRPSAPEVVAHAVHVPRVAVTCGARAVEQPSLKALAAKAAMTAASPITHVVVLIVSSPRPPTISLRRPKDRHRYTARQPSGSP